MMKTKSLGKTILILALLPAVAAFCQQAESRDGLREAFTERWELYYGKAPQAAVIDTQEEASTPESVFRHLWRAYSVHLPEEERGAAEAAFRYHLLGEKKAFLNALNASFSESLLFPTKNGGMLFYLFLEEELSDSSIVRQALPPGENGVNVFEALAQYGETESQVRTRLGVFMLRKMIDQKVLRSLRNDLPLMWSTAKGLKPSEALIGRIPTSGEYGHLRAEVIGDPRPVKIISAFTDLSYKVLRIGVANADDAQLLIPSEQGMMVVALLNASAEEFEEPFSVTFWKEYNHPVSVVSAVIEGGLLKLTLEESGGILGYRLEAAVEKDNAPSGFGLPFVQSAGKGVNDYLFSCSGADYPDAMRLKVYTLGGFVFSMPVQMEK